MAIKTVAASTPSTVFVRTHQSVDALLSSNKNFSIGTIYIHTTI
jgi:hypothetical protein